MTVSEYARHKKISNQTVRNRARDGQLRIDTMANGRTNVVELSQTEGNTSAPSPQSEDLQTKKLLTQIAKMESEIAWKEQKIREHEQKLVDKLHQEYAVILNDVAVSYRRIFEGLKLGRQSLKKLEQLHKRLDQRIHRLIEGRDDEEES